MAGSESRWNTCVTTWANIAMGWERSGSMELGHFGSSFRSGFLSLVDVIFGARPIGLAPIHIEFGVDDAAQRSSRLPYALGGLVLLIAGVVCDCAFGCVRSCGAKPKLRRHKD